MMRLVVWVTCASGRRDRVCDAGTCNVVTAEDGEASRLHIADEPLRAWPAASRTGALAKAGPNWTVAGGAGGEGSARPGGAPSLKATPAAAVACRSAIASLRTA